jgi:threonine synthase
MDYVSTRGESPAIGFAEALLTGLAPDGGLYLPSAWPRLSHAAIAGLAGRPFHDVAVEVIAPFTGGTVARPALEAMAREAYAAFGHPAVTPLMQIAPNRFVLELFHGPTLAFKDVAMQVLARLMDHVLAERRQRATIVGATSGDTGGAAVEAFRGSERVDIVVLFPDGRVSDVQRRMMTTPTEANVHAVAIDGTFDDCQALVKAMFNHRAFRDEVALSAINSINWARIVAQVTYYFAAGVALGAPHRPVRFAVPTGNFGDIFAGHVAARMGLPIERLVIATNDNDILARTAETGRYETRGVRATTSPSMDIQVSSNFERWLYLAADGDAVLVRRQMAGLAQSGSFDLTRQQREAMARELGAERAVEAEVAAAIRARLAMSAYGMEPHTACADVALDKHAARTGGQDGVPEVVLATAHAAKFPDAMEAITGVRPTLPARLGHLMSAPERITRLPNDVAALEAFVRRHSRVASGRAA